MHVHSLQITQKMRVGVAIQKKNFFFQSMRARASTIRSIWHNADDELANDDDDYY